MMDHGWMRDFYWVWFSADGLRAWLPSKNDCHIYLGISSLETRFVTPTSAGGFTNIITFDL